MKVVLALSIFTFSQMSFTQDLIQKNFICMAPNAVPDAQILVYSDRAEIRYSRMTQIYKSISSEDKNIQQYYSEEVQATLSIPNTSDVHDNFYRITLKSGHTSYFDCELQPKEDTDLIF